MRTSFYRNFPLLLLGFVALVLSSCASVLAADPPPPPQVTPDTTDASTLKVTVTINDDQNATDGKVAISLQFATNEIRDPNFIEFTNGEEVSCNGVRLNFNSPNYTTRIGAQNERFTCVYVRQGRTYSISEMERPLLKPYLDHNTDHNPLLLHYKADSRRLGYCQMQVDTSDAHSANASDKFTEGSSGSRQVNQGSLSGVGSLILTRTCSPPITGHATPSDTVDKNAATPFGMVAITYTSIARIFVTWI